VTYDFLRRLTDTWTEAAINCTTKQRTGLDRYRMSWQFDNPTPNANGEIKTQCP